jgi:hypothetical protein
MLDGLPVDLTPWGIVGAIALMVLLGWLVPKRQLDRADRETGYWRDTCTSLTQTVGQMGGQLERLTEYARTADAVLRALPTPDRDKTS